MISLLIPTRGRREWLGRTIVSAIKTAKNPDKLEFVCYVDDDDVASYEKFGFDIAPDLNGNIHFIVGPRIVLSNTWNKCASYASGDILMQGNDDIIFRTVGWDVMVSRAFERCADKILMVHGNDGSTGRPSSIGNFGPHPFVSRRWIEVLGYMTAPYYSSDYGDTHINELANAIGRRRYLQFTVEHMHNLFGKAPIDKTTNERLARHAKDKVDTLYKDLALLRELDIEKLKESLK